jgi:hypothetical protein
MKNRFFALTLYMALVFFPALPAQSAEFSGKYLLQICSSDKMGKELVERGHTACQAYIAGLMDYHNLIKSLRTAPGIDFCIPEGTSLTKLQNILVSYLLSSNLHDDFIASPAIVLAFHKAYPCR